MPSTITRVLVTGASAGLGKECCRQLAEVEGIQKVYLGCRNQKRAELAKVELEEITDKTADSKFFEIVIIDLSKLDSVRAAVMNLVEPIDGLVLNAGGPTVNPLEITPNGTGGGTCNILANNVLGHVLFVDLLLKEKKLNQYGSVIYSGSEAARGVMGQPPPDIKDGSIQEFSSICDGTFVKQNEGLIYPCTKLVAVLWMNYMARKHSSNNNNNNNNNMRFVTISPGGTTGTNIFQSLPFFKRIIFTTIFKLMEMFGKTHNVEIGAKRYVNALLDRSTKKETTYQSGIFYGSKDGISGTEIVDQSIFFDAFNNEEYQDNANTAIHKFL